MRRIPANLALQVVETDAEILRNAQRDSEARQLLACLISPIGALGNPYLVRHLCQRFASVVPSLPDLRCELRHHVTLATCDSPRKCLM